jgi:hypothetical protein
MECKAQNVGKAYVLERWLFRQALLLLYIARSSRFMLDRSPYVKWSCHAMHRVSSLHIRDVICSPYCEYCSRHSLEWPAHPTWHKSRETSQIIIFDVSPRCNQHSVTLKTWRTLWFNPDALIPTTRAIRLSQARAAIIHAPMHCGRSAQQGSFEKKSCST